VLPPRKGDVPGPETMGLETPSHIVKICSLNRPFHSGSHSKLLEKRENNILLINWGL